MSEKGTVLQYIGYSSHDVEAHYKCPFCEIQYGGWDLHRKQIYAGDNFKCEKCGKLLHYS